MMGVDFPNIQQICIVLIGALIVKFLIKKLFNRGSEVQIQKVDWKKDVVYLYQFHRSPVLPNLSPFCLKVETWLRANKDKVTYEIVPSWMLRSKEGLLPFVELNGEHIADSQLIIHKLTKHFNIDMDKDLSPEKQAIGRAVDRMVEGSLLMALICFKVVEKTKEFLHPSVSGAPVPEFVTNLVAPYVHRMIRGRMRSQGIYKHSRSDILDIMHRDLQALSAILGDNKFLLGDRLHAVDCTAFGTLATVFYLPYSQPIHRALQEDFPAVRDYLHRIKEHIWADWDTLITKDR